MPPRTVQEQLMILNRVMVKNNDKRTKQEGSTRRFAKKSAHVSITKRTVTSTQGKIINDGTL